MAKESKQGKPANAPGPEAADWTVHLKNGEVHQVDGAVMRQSAAYSQGSAGYQFRRDGKIVFDAPPGEVAFVAERQPEPPSPSCAVTLPASMKPVTWLQVKDLAEAVNSALGAAGARARVVIVHPDAESERGQ